MKNLLIFFMCFMPISLIIGQGTQVSSAYISYQSYMDSQGKEVNDLLHAKESIDLASKHEKTSLDAKTWYYRGLIYHALSGLKDPQYSKDAASETVNSYQKAMELDTKGKFKSEITNGLTLIQNPLYTSSFEKYKAGEYKAAYEGFSQCLAITELSNKIHGTAVIDTAIIQASTVSADLAGLKSEAKTGYEKLIGLKFNDPSVYQSLARIYMDEGNETKASEILDSGAKLFPDSVPLIIESINILLKNNKAELAKEKMETALKLDPSNATIHMALGTIYETQKDMAKAEESYKQALNVKPDYFDANYNLGSLYYNGAVEKVKAMNELPISDQVNYDRLKKESNDLFTKGLPYFEKALKLNGKDKNTLIALKEIYARQGKTEDYESVKKLLDGL